MKVKVVDECPVCKSNRTGYFIPISTDYAKDKIKHFQRGERVRGKLYSLNNNHNCFCQACGQTWYGKITKQKMSNEEFQTYLEVRGFFEERSGYLKKTKIMKHQKKEVKVDKKERLKIFATALFIFTGFDIRGLFSKKEEPKNTLTEEEEEILEQLN